MSYRRAVLALADALPADLPWAVTASANLALRGLPVAPGDVDVMTDADGAYRIAETLPDAVTRPIRPPEEAAAERIRSHFGALSLSGVAVEVMGAVEHRVDGEWVPTDDVATAREFIDVDGQSVPVMPLAHEERAYRDLGRDERAALVAGWSA